MKYAWTCHFGQDISDTAIVVVIGYFFQLEDCTSCRLDGDEELVLIPAHIVVALEVYTLIYSNIIFFFNLASLMF